MIYDLRFAILEARSADFRPGANPIETRRAETGSSLRGEPGIAAASNHQS